MNNKKKYSHDLVRVKKIRSLLINFWLGREFGMLQFIKYVS